MALTIGDNFSYQGAKPLDARLTYATLANMVAAADSTLYSGIMAYCVGEDKNYQWKSTNTADPTLGKWREFQSGSGGASELANLDDVDLDAPADGEVLKYDATEEKWVNGEDVGGAGRAKSTAIAPVFDDTATYAAGDRVTYEDELYVFNKAHTGAWAAADADKSDVDSEMPEKLTAAQMAAIKAAFVIDAPRNGYPVLFDETGAEHFVGWYKLANGTKKPVYEKSYSFNSPSTPDVNSDAVTHGLSIDVLISMTGTLKQTDSSNIYLCDINAYLGTNDQCMCWLRPTTIAMRVTSTHVNRPCVLVLRYTKTTDQPQ